VFFFFEFCENSLNFFLNKNELIILKINTANVIIFKRQKILPKNDLLFTHIIADNIIHKIYKIDEIPIININFFINSSVVIGKFFFLIFFFFVLILFFDENLLKLLKFAFFGVISACCGGDNLFKF
jgi:hypothetical protein